MINFALDIGTRTVTGIILDHDGENYHVVDYITKEHEERAMRDGQIHDVVAVASVIRDVKTALEERTGLTLTEASVAAAGRALKTMEAKKEIPLNKETVQTEEQIRMLELQAVQNAQHQLANKDKQEEYSNYYCVGYSVMYYTLDGEKIGSLIDQKGDVAGAEVIATFLPRIVVESLLAALKRAGLDMAAMTLEPIAAIQVLIPESMRRLNVALVDIGAGTSDIALTDRGTVIAYGMVPVAGDEITEAISDHYLLDFKEAEKTKRQVVTDGQGTIMDILGFETEITLAELSENIHTALEKLAASIADEIISLNGNAPRAAMLIGGGSLTPELNKLLAEKLELPVNRVAIRDIQAIEDMVMNENTPTGPEYVTPLGIAIAANKSPIHYVTVDVNGMAVRLFELKELTIADSLLSIGMDINKHYGEPGEAISVKVNETDVIVPGTLGQTPSIRRNGMPATVEERIYSGDTITITKGARGKDAWVTIDDLIGADGSYHVYLDGERYNLPTMYFVNGNQASKDYLLQDKDDVIWHQEWTVAQFLEQHGLKKQGQEPQSYVVYLNQRRHVIPVGGSELFVNGRKAQAETVLKQADILEMKENYKEIPCWEDVLRLLEMNIDKNMDIYFNGEPVQLQQKIISIKRHHDEKVGLDDRIENGAKVTIEKNSETPFIFQDVFRYVDLDLSKIKPGFQLYQNEQPTTFDAPLQTGDRLEIKYG